MVSGMLWAVIRMLYGRSVDMGRQRVMFRVDRWKNRGRGSLRRPYFYRMYIQFQGKELWRMITEQEYETALNERTGWIFVYLREYKSRILSPEFEKYEFQLELPDYKEQDSRKCTVGFLVSAAVTEALILMIGLQL